MYQNTINDFERIHTNLPPKRLIEVAQAILDKKVVWDDSKDSMLAEYFGTEFNFEGARYKYEEMSESPNSLSLIFGLPEFVRELIGEHEIDLAVVVEKREYEKAEKINSKINSLKMLL